MESVDAASTARLRRSRTTNPMLLGLRLDILKAIQRCRRTLYVCFHLIPFRYEPRTC